MDYKDKYLKYKTKYLKLVGGSKLIVHISGPQGAEKTTLGNKIKEKYKNSIIVKDLDDLFDDFNNQNKIKDYQHFIDNFIKNNSNKPLIITGLTAERCKGEMNNDDNTFYEINTEHKYLIEINENDILKQRFMRQVSKLNERKEKMFDAWLENNDEIQKKLFRFVNISKWKSNNVECNLIHKEHGYKSMNRDDIYDIVCELINKRLDF